MSGLNDSRANGLPKDGFPRMWGTRREIVLTENVLSNLPRKYHKILDVGCGDGYLCYLLTKRGTFPAGIDVNKSRLKYAHHKCPEADFIVGDGRFLPFRGEIVEAVVCCEVFEHVKDYPLIINEIRRVTKKGGKLLATVPYKMHEHINSFDEQKIRSNLQNAGYNVKRVYGIGFEFEGIGKRFPRILRIPLHKVAYRLFKRANFIFTASYKDRETNQPQIV
jgi:SAM-dependent methyltransferase